MKFRKFQQNKLWRDKLPEAMESMGSKVHWTQLNDQLFEKELKLKLREETEEVAAASTKQELKAELADVLEVVHAFCSLHEFSFEEVVAEQLKKRQERGGFFQRKFVTVAEHAQDSFGEKYCLAAPNKYPEIVD